MPEYTTGDECLFCHRKDVGPTWAANRHNLTLRPVDPELPALKDLGAEAGKVELLMGSQERVRFLKRSKGYGKLDLWDATTKTWDPKTFADRCAGCHATAVEAKARAFSAVSLDCFVCHGDVPAGHTKDPALVHLSRKRQDSARVVTSICASCHVRTGTARSTGLPYPNQFVAGDNLFRDFLVDFAPEKLKELNPGDRHVLENVRDVVALGKEDVTCLTCHDVHGQSAKKHHRAPRGDSCLTCHNATGPRRVRPPYEVRSKVCGY